MVFPLYSTDYESVKLAILYSFSLFSSPLVSSPLLSSPLLSSPLCSFSSLLLSSSLFFSSFFSPLLSSLFHPQQRSISNVPVKNMHGSLSLVYYHQSQKYMNFNIQSFATVHLKVLTYIKHKHPDTYIYICILCTPTLAYTNMHSEWSKKQKKCTHILELDNDCMVHNTISQKH